MKEWIGELEHRDLKTTDAMAALDKYNSAEDALVGGLNAMKQIGKPFKLPESLDKLPDDATRQSFTNQINKILGAVEKEEDLADVDFAEGLADARSQKEGLVEAIKKFSIGKPKSIIKEIVKFINSNNQEIINNKKNDEIKLAQEVKGNLSTLYGGDKAVDDNYENVRRLFQNHMGLSEDEYNQAGKDFIEKVLMKNTVITKGLMNLAKEIVKEGTTEPPGSQPSSQPQDNRISKKDGPSGKALGWNK